MFSEKDATHGVFVVLAGEVKLSINSSDGRRLSLRIAKKGEVLGLASALAGKPYELTAETLVGIRAHEPGTLLYATSRVADDPAGRVFFEVYRDRDAFDSHEAQPHTRRFLAERVQLLEGFEVSFLSGVAAKGIAGIDE